MVTDAGTVALAGSLLVKLTVKSPAVPKLRVTVTTAVPPFSAIVVGATETLNVDASAVVKFQVVASVLAIPG